MSTELRDALAAAGDAARASFEGRDAADVITPASRRVRRDRAAMVAASTVGVLTLAGGVLWGAENLGATRLGTLDPAATNSAHETPDSTGVLGETPWSTLSLAAVAEPRAIGEKRADSVAGMICHHAEPTDDPRVDKNTNPDLVTSDITGVEDCAPVWFKDGPYTSLNNLTLATDPTSINAHTLVRNDSGRPLAIDTDSVFVWLETDPNEPSDTLDGGLPHVLMAGSMWDAAGSTIALLGSDDAMSIVEPADYLPVTVLASHGGQLSEPLAQLIDSGEPYTVTFWARIHEENPTGDATYLIELGTSQEFGGIDGQ